MKVFLVNNLFRFRGGVETVVETTHQLLKHHKVLVTQINRDSRDLINKPLGKFQAFFSGIYSRSAYTYFIRLLKTEKPDIVHVHNLYPLLSPSILVACKELGIPVVMTCHTYQLMCPQGQHFNGRTICESCLGGKEYWCVLKNCRNNIFESTAYALRSLIARKFNLFSNNVTAYITLSNFAKDRLINAGFNKDRIFVLPNIAPIKSSIKKDDNGNYAAFAGRLSQEKGIDVLLNASANLPDIPLLLAGEGPLYDRLKRNASPAAKFLGRLNRQKMNNFYNNARFLVFPSNWFEVCPMVILEAMGWGIPVIASGVGGLPELVENHVTGLLFKPGNSEDLAGKMLQLWSNPMLCKKMGKAAREKAIEKYNENSYYEQLISIYKSAINYN